MPPTWLTSAHVSPAPRAERLFDAGVHGTDFILFKCPVASPIAQRKSEALTTFGNRSTAVDVEELHAFEKRPSGFPDRGFDGRVWSVFVDHDRNVSIGGREARSGLDRQQRLPGGPEPPESPPPHPDARAAPGRALSGVR